MDECGGCARPGIDSGGGQAHARKPFLEEEEQRAINGTAVLQSAVLGGTGQGCDAAKGAACLRVGMPLSPLPAPWQVGGPSKHCAHLQRAEHARESGGGVSWPPALDRYDEADFDGRSHLSSQSASGCSLTRPATQLDETATACHTCPYILLPYTRARAVELRVWSSCLVLSTIDRLAVDSTVVAVWYPVR